jgi:hypothetical protein
MKKGFKKLTLHRETLRNLQATALVRAVGGGETFEIETTCACTDTCRTDWSCAGCGSGWPCGTDTCGSVELQTTCVCC